LDNESFQVQSGTINEYETLKTEISNLLTGPRGEYIEVYVILSDVNGQDYLFQRHYISGVHDDVIPVAFHEHASSKKSNVVKSPWEALLKFSTASALDAIFQAIGNKIGRPEVETWGDAFASISGGSVFLSGVSSLIPWRKNGPLKCLGDSIVNAVTAVLAGMTSETYTINKGIKDFLFAGGISFSVCLVTPYITDRFKNTNDIKKGAKALDEEIENNIPTATPFYRFIYFRIEKFIYGLPDQVNAWKGLFDFPNLRVNSVVLYHARNWGGDILAKFKNVGSKNPTFYNKVNNFPAVAKYFDEGFPIIKKNNPANKEVELDMYALDRSRPERTGGNSIFESSNPTSYKINTTKVKYDDIHTNVNPQSGKIKDNDGIVIHTDNVNGDGLMYAVDEAGNVHIGTRGGTANSFPHPTLIGGINPNVKSAGMIKFKEGRILEINNNSGHFKPSAANLQQIESIFQNKFPANSFDLNFSFVNVAPQ